MTFLVITMAYVITKLPLSLRSFTFAVVAVCLVAVVITGLAMGWHELVFRSFGKDSSMTGRTVLWGDGIKIGMEKPLLGHGYSAFWVQGNPKARAPTNQ